MYSTERKEGISLKNLVIKAREGDAGAFIEPIELKFPIKQNISDGDDPHLIYVLQNRRFPNQFIVLFTYVVCSI